MKTPHNNKANGIMSNKTKTCTSHKRNPASNCTLFFVFVFFCSQFCQLLLSPAGKSRCSSVECSLCAVQCSDVAGQSKKIGRSFVHLSELAARVNQRYKATVTGRDCRRTLTVYVWFTHRIFEKQLQYYFFLLFLIHQW